MYNSAQELAAAVSYRMEKVPLEVMKLDLDKELIRLFALYRLYQEALEEAEQYGWIGVGCITFAEGRLREAQSVTAEALRSYPEPEHE